MENLIVNKFNRGEIDPRALARDDFTKAVNSCALMENFIPGRLGPMSFRPGTEYIGACISANSHLVPFVSGLDTDEQTVLELENQVMRVWVDDTLLTRTSVTTTITNGDFAVTPLSSGWTDASGAGSTVGYDATNDYALLTGAGGTSAAIWQQFGTVQTGAEHAIRITVLEAPVVVYLGYGTTAKLGDIFHGELGVGVHSLVFTPTSANVTITLENSKKYRTAISEVAFETTGTFTIGSPVATAYLSSIRYRQSADVMFLAWSAGAQFKVERRGAKSWSVVWYQANDGPFRAINDTAITLTPAALSGNTTLTASAPLFQAGHLGCLFRVLSATQQATADVTAEDTGTAGVRVVGTGNNRDYQVVLDFTTGSGVGTITLQRSSDNITWADMVTFTADTDKTYNDGFDDAIFYYRLYCKTGDYASGTISLSISTLSGSIDGGVARVTGVTSTTVVTIQVLKDFLSTDATRDWYEGAWSTVNGHPTSVSLYEGRLGWAGRTRIWLSASDRYYTFDDLLEGDSAPVTRTVGFGPVEDISWMAESTRLVLGLATDIVAVRTNSFGEVLTQLNANLKSGSTQGTANIDAVRLDDTVFYAHRSGTRLMSLDYQLDRDINAAADRSILNQDLCDAGIKRIAIQQNPETRVFVLLNDGECRVLTFEPVEDVQAWSRLVTIGTIEDMTVVPGPDEDRLYFVVSRNSGAYLEKLSTYADAEAAILEKTLDSWTAISGNTSATISGLTHLAGEKVSIRASGADIEATYRVSAGGSITLPAVYSSLVVGIPYTAGYISNKLNGYTAGSVLSRLKRIVSSSLIMYKYRDRAVQVGYNASTGLGDMPLIENGTTFTEGQVVSGEYDEIPFEFDGDTETDPRVYIKAIAACTILAMVLEIESGYAARSVDLSKMGA